MAEKTVTLENLTTFKENCDSRYEYKITKNYVSSGTLDKFIGFDSLGNVKYGDIKTVNGVSLIGSGNIVISTEGTININDTTGSESITDGNKTLTVVTRTTPQEISGVKTFVNTPILSTGMIANNSNNTFKLPGVVHQTLFTPDLFNIRTLTEIVSTNNYVDTFATNYGIGSHLVRLSDGYGTSFDAFLNIYSEHDVDSDMYYTVVKIQATDRNDYALYKYEPTNVDLQLPHDKISDIWDVAYGVENHTLNGTVQLVDNNLYRHNLHMVSKSTDYPRYDLYIRWISNDKTPVTTSTIGTDNVGKWLGGAVVEKVNQSSHNTYAISWINTNTVFAVDFGNSYLEEEYSDMDSDYTFTDSVTKL